MSQLPAFLAATMGSSLVIELTILIAFVLLLNVRRAINLSLLSLRKRPAEAEEPQQPVRFRKRRGGGNPSRGQ